jgi:lipopolysaccharide/colanic/teichoic acid biosynthesis glycosyltransferase/SAM-dependent methyltransferase
MIPVIIGLKLTGEHYIFYLQPRVGKGGKEFNIIKFATMLKDSPNMQGGVLTQKDDPRILPMGKFLRKTKINELPQLINILVGQMSFIGPRPQARQHYDLYNDEVKKAINRIPPGLSGIGSIIFRNEEAILDRVIGDRNSFHDTIVAPYKGRLEIWYCDHRNIWVNLLLILITGWMLFRPKSDIVFYLFKDLPPLPEELKDYLKMNGKFSLPQPVINDIIQWDIKSWEAALKYWQKNINWKDISHCLALGERKGGLALWLALNGKQVLCSDLENTKEQALILHKKYKVTDKVQYEDIDATNIPYENQFDIVIFKSILGGIGRNNNIELQQRTVNEIHKALKPGGKLLFAENLRASPAHQFFRNRFVKWGRTWRYVSISELENFFSVSSFAGHKINSTGVLAAFGRTERQRNLLSVIDRGFMNYIFPKNWKYIAYGIVEK